MHRPDGAPAESVLLDWNESPIGPPQRAIDRVVSAAATLHRYPRGLMDEVAGLAAGYLGVSPTQILLTAGVDEAVDIALSLGRRAWGVVPGFDGYRERAEANGKPFCPVPLGPDWQPGPGWDALGDGDIVFLAQPGNPTGTLVSDAFLDRIRGAATYLFLDETYQDFSSCPSALAEAGPAPGLLVYRSFSKAMGLAGIRLGCLVADAATIARLEPLRRFMPIDAVSLNAAAGLLEDPGFVKQLTDHVAAARVELAAILRDCGLFAEVRSTEANFALARLPADGGARLLDGLAQAQIRVRTCDPFGLPGWIRVSVGSWDDQRRLQECLRRLAELIARKERHAHP